MTAPQVVIIILNWNNAPDTLVTVGSAMALDYPTAEVLVIDNGSTDESCQTIRAAFPDAELLETGLNLGYAGGNNVGLAQALERGAEYAFILNNDVTLAPDVLSILVETLVQAKAACIATPMVVYADEPGVIWALGSCVDRRTASVVHLHQGEQVAKYGDGSPHVVGVASGAAMLVRLDAVRRLGAMDEDFFLYYEETDWCLRLARYGCSVLAVPAAIVAHQVSATLGPSSPVIDYYMLRNHLRFVSRNWGGLRRDVILGRLLVRNLMTILAYSIKSCGGRRLPHRNARVLALRDAFLGRWGKMGPDVEAVCKRRPT